MITIAIDEEKDESSVSNEENTNVATEEDEKKYELHLKPKRIEEFKELYSCSIVHDFGNGDLYHKSEEERKKENKFYEVFKKFSRYKHKYRKLPEFITAYREGLKCLYAVAEKNGIYDPDEFIELYFKGKIYIDGLILPVFKGKERKTIDHDYLVDFILSDEDPRNILPKEEPNTIYDEEDLETARKRLFSDERWEYLTNEGGVNDIVRTYDLDEEHIGNNDNIVLQAGKKDEKKMFKKSSVVYTLKKFKRRAKDIEAQARYIYDFNESDMDMISRYDKKNGYTSNAKIPKFKGDLMNDDDYNRYMDELQEYEDTQFKENYNGTLISKEEAELLELKTHLEANGWNVRNMFGNKEKERKLKKLEAMEKSKEKELRRKLTDIEKRRKRRLGIADDENYDDSLKSKKKRRKREEKARKKAKKKREKLEKKGEESINNFLQSLGNGLEYDDFGSYEKDITDWSWDNIMDKNNDE